MLADRAENKGRGEKSGVLLFRVGDDELFDQSLILKSRGAQL